jgi:nitrate reductase cytochrome c-type subunit
MNRFHLKLVLILFAALFLISSCKNQITDKETNSSESLKALTSNSNKLSKQDYLKKGKSIALSGKETLGKELTAAISNRGTENALEFCNLQAIPLTDSIAKELNAKIKRVSDKNRNPDNVASTQELEYLMQAKKQLENEGKAVPMIFEDKNRMIGYYPIVTNALCMQCHGNFETDISDATKKAIKNNYPNDKAVGYSINELRGIWVIEMEK